MARFRLEHTRSGRHYFTQTATFKPAKIVTTTQWQTEPSQTLDYFESQLTRGYRKLTRYGAKSKVAARQIVAEVYILRPENVAAAREMGETLSQFAEHYRAGGTGRGDMSKGISGTVWVSNIKEGLFVYWTIGGFQARGGEVLKRFSLKRFIRQSMTEILNAALGGESARAVAIFELQMRAYT